jgi:hypothetical protein
VSLAFNTGKCTVSAKPARYWAVLEVSEPDADDVDGELWSQQHGATAHRHVNQWIVLTAIFSGRALELFGDVAWPASSPEPSASDCFLCGPVKARVYVNKPPTLGELKQHWGGGGTRTINRHLLYILVIATNFNFFDKQTVLFHSLCSTTGLDLNKTSLGRLSQKKRTHMLT